MSDFDNRPTRDVDHRLNQDGFSIVEMLVVITVMMIVVGAVFSLMRDSMKVAMTTYEMTDAQQNMRIAHQFISRDLMNAGDGLQSISYIEVPQTFVTSYITLNPVTNSSTPGIINLAVFTSDNNVPANIAVTGAVPAATVRTGTDRQTILAIDPDMLAISLSAAAINSTGSVITLPAGPVMSAFTIGEVYFLTSSAGATFGTITSINASARQLTFANGDTFGLNLTGSGGHIRSISASGSRSASIR